MTTEIFGRGYDPMRVARAIEDPDEDVVICPECGETLDDGSEICWECANKPQLTFDMVREECDLWNKFYWMSHGGR